jgi:phage repressor protein C with HTH and peptisase S24 domain
MLRHADVWRAIDRLAEQHGLSASGLARRSGLDPTTFNKSKRVARDGKPRWPTTESIAKVLAATRSSLGDFVAVIGEDPADDGLARIPMIGTAQAASVDYFDGAGRPAGSGWRLMLFPEARDPHLYALEVGGDGMEPAYHDGDVIIVSPAASVRRGHRVVVRTVDDEILIRRLARRTAGRIELASAAGAWPTRVLASDQVAWMSRVLWVSQ